MKTYKIIMERSTETEYFVEAENEEEANEKFIEGDYDEGETEIVTSETNEPLEINNG